MTKEIWKDIRGYKGYYQVSASGKVRGLKRIIYRKLGNNTHPAIRKLKIIVPSNSHGYLRLTLSKGSEETKKSVHRLVLEAFKGKPLSNQQCRHLDGDPRNNHVSNLCWGTAKENAADKRRHGASKGPCGERNGFAKLTEKQVLLIRKLKQRVSVSNLARRFSISRVTVYRIVSRKNWKHI